MNTRSIFKSAMLGLAVAVLLLADVSPQAPFVLTLTREAAAIIGMPFTPFSYAGVARRTTRRFVAFDAAATSAAVATTQAATAQQQAAVAQQQARAAGAPAIGAIVNALPAGCVSAPQGGIEYYHCGNAYYRTAFQGSNLVYVVAQP